VSWFLVWISVKLDNTKDVECWSSEPGHARDTNEFNYILFDIKKGNYWWLLVPFINLIAAVIYLIRGIHSFFHYNFKKVSTKKYIDKIIDFLFGPKTNFRSNF
jgi:hypothetical protein